MTHILILGATGQVGGELLKLALADPRVDRVTAPTRRPLQPQPRLLNPIIDFGNLPEDEAWWQADIAFCALGTTLRQAGSRAAFYRVDHDAVSDSAQRLRAAGTPVLGLVSSLGADPTSRIFYLRVKGETERDLVTLAFPSLVLIRPSLLIGGPRAEGRPLEAAGLFLGKWLSGLLPRRYHAVRTQAVAQALYEACTDPKTGVHIIDSASIPA
jgi:uncharacterized protein YbjT (DUF2867 family)